MEVQVKWQDPPASRTGRRSSLAPVVAVLKQNPGRWALVQEGMKASSGGAPWRKHGCEARAVSREEKDRKVWDVYARWPEKTAKAAAPKPVASTHGTVQPVTAGATRAAATRPTPIPDVPGMTPPATLNMDDPKDVALWEQRVRFEQSRRRRGA